jgi:hypothetical protein
MIKMQEMKLQMMQMIQKMGQTWIRLFFESNQQLRSPRENTKWNGILQIIKNDTTIPVPGFLTKRKSNSKTKYGLTFRDLKVFKGY